MSKTFVNKGIKTTDQPVGRPRKHAPPPTLNATMTALDEAITASRPPTTVELLQECKCLIGTTLIALRGSQDAYRASTAISNLVRAIATVSTAERVEEISDEVLENMSIDELKTYTNKMLDRLN